MLHAFVTLTDEPDALIATNPVRRTNYRAGIALALSLALSGCNSTPAPTAPAATPAAKPPPTATFPPRPTTTPAPFKLFHYYKSSFTLTTPDNATDDQIAALVWQLRDAARTHTLDKLKLSQKDVDAGSLTWFHIYRGTKCASEKYTEGKLPCEASYHASGDYTFTAKPLWDKGVLLHDEHETSLWDTEAPYTPPAPQ